VTLCEATVVQNDQEAKLEERVHIDGNIVEAIRRCISSQAEGPINVVECLLSLPYLQTPNDDDCPLGNRAKLRLLEDAMIDACDQEGENDLLDELDVRSEQHEKEESTTQNSKRTKI